MEKQANKTNTEKETFLIATLYRWLDDENEARKNGQHLLAFFIALAINEAKSLLNSIHKM